MNLKRWFAWMCLVLVLVTEVLLFQAYRERDILQAQLRSGQMQLRQTQDELNVLKSADVGLEAAEISRLGKINADSHQQGRDAGGRHPAVVPNQPVKRPTSGHRPAGASTSAGTICNDFSRKMTRLWTPAPRSIIAQKTCINNLRLIDDAKQQWAKDNSAAPTAVPTQKDLLPYLKNNVFPGLPRWRHLFHQRRG